MLILWATGANGSGQQTERVCVLLSSSTPADLRQAVCHTKSHSDSFVSIEYSPFASSTALPCGGVLDLLWCESLSRLYLPSHNPEVPLVSGNEYLVRGMRALDFGPETELSALWRVSRWLGVRRLFVLLSPLSSWLPSINAIFEQEFIEVLRIHEDSSTADIDAVVRRLIIPFGFTSFLIHLPPQVTKKLLQRFDSEQLTTSRLTILLSERAAQYRFNVTSEELPEFKYISPFFVTKRNCSTANAPDELLLCQTQLALSAGDDPAAMIMRIANGTAQAIGWVKGENIEFSAYQENQLQPNRSEVFLTIPISLNGGEYNPSGFSDVSQAHAAKGALLAVKEVNSHLGVLPFCTLQVANLSLGVDEFDAAWVQSRLASLGVAHITGVFSSLAYGVYNLLRDLNISVPQVGATTTLPQFSSKAQFPLFTRVAMSDAYLAVIYTRLMTYFEWTHVGIICVDNIWSETLANLIINEAKKLNIGVCNNRTTVAVGAQSNSTDLLQVVQEVVESKVRVLIIIAYGDTFYAILEALYSLGIRGGDLVVIAVEWLVPVLYDIQDPGTLSIVTELTQGAIMFYPSSFVGTVGPAVMQKFTEEYKETMSVHGCYYYDAALAIAHTLDFMVAKGTNWKDAELFDRAIRDVHFTGCTGLVTIEQKTNDRAPTSYTIFNARRQNGGSLGIEVIGSYDPTGVVLFRFSQDIQWPGFSTAVPTDMRENLSGCPFEQRHSIRYRPAVVLSAATIAGVCAVSICSCVYIWKKYWDFEAKPMNSRVLASFDDLFVFIAIALEAAQYLATGLQLQDWAVLLEWGARLCAARFEVFVSFGSAAYWGIFYSAIAAVVMWTFFLILAKVQSSRWWKCVCEVMGAVAETACPLLGDICFIPIVSTLLAIFQCPNVVSKPSEDPALHRAYLEWDCQQFCWSDWHLAFSIVSLICLLIYIPSAVYMRPAWQHVPVQLHIHSSPAFLMLKSIYQLSIVTVDRALKTKYPTCAAVTFLLLTAFFGVATIRLRPFNYSRANLWYFLSVLCVAYTAVLHILQAQLPATSAVLWLALLILGVLSTFIFGFIYQRIKLPSKFTSRKSIEVTELFHFMFSRGSRYLHIFSKPKAASSGDESAITPRRVPFPGFSE